jgi:ABC-2 type transport system ATP-binding protein
VNVAERAPAPAIPSTRRDSVAELLWVADVVKRWRRAPAPVLDGADLIVDGGEAVHVQGRNGAGKTTLLRIIAGLIAPDAGTVQFASLEPARDRREYQRRVRFASAAGTGLYARLTVRQHLDFCARLLLLPPEACEAAIAQAMNQFHLDQFADSRTDRLSTGQRQRVRLSLSFMADPQLVLLDEPSNSLDDDGLAILTSAVNEIVSGGGCVVWVSPGRDGQLYRFDRELQLVRGRLES